MPEMICRSSFRSGPGWSLGMNGSITTHCSSESQNRSAIVTSKPQTAAWNHKLSNNAMPWFGSHPRAHDFVSAHRKPPALLRFNDLDAFLFHTSKARERAERLNTAALTEFVVWIDHEWAAWADMLIEPFASLVDRAPIKDSMILTIAAGVPTACTVVQAATASLPRSN